MLPESLLLLLARTYGLLPRFDSTQTIPRAESRLNQRSAQVTYWREIEKQLYVGTLCDNIAF